MVEQIEVEEELFCMNVFVDPSFYNRHLIRFTVYTNYDMQQ